MASTERVKQWRLNNPERFRSHWDNDQRRTYKRERYRNQNPPLFTHCTACNELLPEKRAKDRQFCDRRCKQRSLRQIILKAYGGQCACCGEHRPEFLSIDHVNKDG